MKNINLLLGLSLLVLIASCEKEAEESPIPPTYNFENVNYSGQTARLDMLAEMTTEMKKANTGGTVDATKLLDMYSNESNPFGEASLNSSGKDLKSKTYANPGAIYSASTFEYLMNYLGQNSADAGNTWAPGTAGVATSGTKAYFFDAYGVEYTQIIEKGLMGAVFYYNVSEVYTREAKIGNAVDNTIVTDGEGTDMEHHWDEAFGYLGIPKDLTLANYATKLDAGEVRYHGKYAEKGQNAGLNTVGNILDYLIKGRYGISHKEYNLRDEAAIQVRAEYEMIIATTAIHYINSAQSNFSDDALRNHALSEAYAFLISLHYNSDKKISATDLEMAKAYFQETPPGAPNPVPSFLNISNQDLNAVKDIISTSYNLDAVKNNL